MNNEQILLILLFVFPLFYCTGVHGSDRVYELIEDKSYDRALERTSRIRASDERVFMKGLIQFKRGNYVTARTKFKELLDEYPNSPRATDSEYYLDRIKLYAPDTVRIPKLRIRLAKSKTVNGKWSGSLTFKNQNNETVGTLTSGRLNWTLNVREGRVIFDSSKFTLRAGQLRVIPSASTRLTLNGKSYRGIFVFKPGDDQVSVVNRLPVNKYLYGVVRKEIAPNWPMAVVKAQAVAARSFAVKKLNEKNEKFDIGSKKLAQVYGGIRAETPRVKSAIENTRGEVLVDRGKVVPAFFHSNSGGHIETAEDVWNGTRTPYIISRPDTWSESTQHSQWTSTVAISTLNEKLRANELPAMSRSPTLQVSKKLESGRAKNLNYQMASGGYKTVEADDFRLAVGSDSIKSSWFTSVRDRGGSIEFKGKGWGHGVGMSQWGAKHMANEGLNYLEILKFYYRGANLAKQFGPTRISRKAVNQRGGR